mmetsp:Transcript_5323/g.15506  ORF Transcript_5323/g.15506 Transcript_5323/m.15506 type:complete len:221 (-) Transcript_5323:891-1553(-)
MAAAMLPPAQAVPLGNDYRYNYSQAAAMLTPAQAVPLGYDYRYNYGQGYVQNFGNSYGYNYIAYGYIPFWFPPPQAQANVQAQAKVQAQTKVQAQAKIQAQTKVQVQAKVEAEAEAKVQAQTKVRPGDNAAFSVSPWPPPSSNKRKRGTPASRKRAGKPKAGAAKPGKNITAALEEHIATKPGTVACALAEYNVAAARAVKTAKKWVAPHPSDGGGGGGS